MLNLCFSKYLTKDIIPLTEATEDSIGNTAINIVDSKISFDEFLTLAFNTDTILTLASDIC